ncbi:putative Na+ driven multidrug efflux pump [Vibrio nigripulchritudo SFn27]|uniref:Multidrug export protein MepA n=1 Tax=Vibrio nigripulchritudo TaxID=28173 RepID=U4K5Y9_9VIBR|nr:MATE family efflux transporter [Vibrio nigripulchritudo]CCN80459.1 putative Na+ driven multidrug efflux pump [Vibrio nigripulchritudo BLFn1]CCN86932.1 putative Na+ driven multidrug efflux pump [Vibrio nigripulchritudo SFn27]CCN92393.1 putative Na+ driven multidrug efflux pump [Vibrio nigripulchritudo ENn2]CCO39733.1 putative Na+ driven multidrug efflux pump [Vibrio nigripulchritudo SFn135]CCO53338.1 putative Na+ driven multidrug efflux pump [Vibrio nigripulchritudo Wn13]
MKNDIDLDNAPINTTFFKYLAPAVLGMIVKSVFIIVDLMFVGRGVGSLGLGAISLTVPFFSFSSAIATMIGIGGATIMSVQFGKSRPDVGQCLFEVSLLITLTTAIVLVSSGLYWLDEIVSLMGASGELAQLSVDYLSIMLYFFVLHSVGWMLSAFVRNDTNPSLVMKGMLAGAITNIVLDYLFIFEFGWGIRGAALATGIGQTVIFVFTLTHFIMGSGKLRLKLSGGYRWKNVTDILKIGSPIFFIESTTAVTTLVFNYVLLSQYSSLHVTAYSIVMNVSLVVMFFMTGIGQACQPIISYNHGAGRKERLESVLKLGLRYATLTGVIAIIVPFIFAEHIVAVFTTYDQELISLATKAMHIYFLGAVLMGWNLVIANYFQAIAIPFNATVISLSRGVVFVVIGLLTLPFIFPDNGVWGSVLMAETITAIIAIYMLIKHKRNSKPNLKTVNNQ